MHAPRLIVVLVSVTALLVAGCGSQNDDSTPVACREGTGAYLKALRAAPGRVTLGDETLISECLAENQQAGDLATVGEAMVAAATKLNTEARVQPGGDAAVELGYLLGAAERGAEKTEGIHADLIRRLTVAARFAPADDPLPAEFLDAYREGFDAGRENG
ncbi:MAG TPA: hypothetical protein VFJ57_06520 [Solirubrobacterales bacterium]|nr:hypothetical protein [Solirubrobacterales bacterium]